MLQLLFYLCSDEPDMPEIEHPQKRRTLSGGVRAPEEPRVWDVGVRISNVIRRYKNSGGSSQPAEGYEPGSHASPRPHVRSAHWHTYWIGPRQAAFPERKPILKWIPPIPIGMDWKRELPTTIRNVVNGENHLSFVGLSSELYDYRISQKSGIYRMQSSESSGNGFRTAEGSD